MTPTILRIALMVAMVLGVGVIANIFSSQERYAGQQQAGGGPSEPVLVKRTLATKQLSREANEKRLLDAVRRELEGRGYLASSAVGSIDSANKDVATIDVATKAAILAFEFDHNLGLTALPSERVLKALIFTHTATGAQRSGVPETPAAGELIGEVQRALAHLGYGQPDITAQLDDATRKAIQKFERARGLQVSGRVSAPLIESLGPAFDAAQVGSSGATGAGVLGNAPTKG